jgi:hypothetical protein
MSKVTRKAIVLGKLVSSDSVNARLADNYDLESLRPQVIGKGRIVSPLVVEPIDGTDTYMVLQGNRRKRVADLITNDPAAPADVKAALAKIDCVVYEGLTDEERDALIFDHGESRPLNREETVLSVWRLFKQFKKEREIGQRLYYQLARYTGNERKLNTLPADPAARDKYLATWFRGTLGGYILAAATMTDEVREAMLLTARKEDGRLKEGESVPFLATRERVVELSKARTADEKAQGWNPSAGGETFNTTIQRFKDEDAGRATSGKKATRPSVKDLNDRAAMFKSAALKGAFAVAAGDDTAGAALLTMDDAIHRQTIVSEVIVKALPTIGNPDVRALLNALIGSGPAADVEAALAPFVK